VKFGQVIVSHNKPTKCNCNMAVFWPDLGRCRFWATRERWPRPTATRRWADRDEYRERDWATKERRRAEVATFSHRRFPSMWRSLDPVVRSHQKMLLLSTAFEWIYLKMKCHIQLITQNRNWLVMIFSIEIDVFFKYFITELQFYKQPFFMKKVILH
jgi:hypothetical protein